MQPPNDVQVAVIGFGPSGAVAASLLGRRGIRTLALDRSREVYDKPRAIALDHEIMRLFDNLGVADAVAPHVAPFPASHHYGVDGQLIRRIDMVPAPYPLGYVPTVVFTQPPVEAALRAHAAARPGVHVRLGTELLDLEPQATGVRLRLRSDSGEAAEVTADYVIACDGAASGVRQQLGIALDDLVFDEPWLVVDVQVHPQALGKLPETAAQFCDPARPTTFIVGPGRHRRWEIMLLPGEDPRAAEQPDRVWKLLSPWLDREDGVLWRAASYRFHALVAREWRRGRVFLAGDAAHQQPPFLGQGMCQGLRDVSNLVWKLDAVLKGRAPDSLLDSYGAERSAHVRELTGAIKEIGRAICERDPARARERDARLLALGGGTAPTVTRQEIVPPLRTGLLSSAGRPGTGQLIPQPRVRTGSGETCLMDQAVGTGWRLVVDGRGALRVSGAVRGALSRLGAGIVLLVSSGRVGVDWQPRRDPSPAGEGGLAREREPGGVPGRVLPTPVGFADSALPSGFAGSRGGITAEPDEHCPDHLVVETEGVLAAWFDARGCRAALVRPDHYVFGVAVDDESLDTLVAELASRLALPTGSPHETARSTA